MATIHKRKLRSGEVVWELTHGTGTDRQRFTAGRTKEEAEEILRQFNRQLAMHGEAPSDGGITSVIGLYGQHLKTNRRATTVTRYMRVLKTFNDCFLAKYHAEVRRLREVRPTHIEEFKRRRSDGDIYEDTSDAERAREQAMRLDPSRTTKDRGKFGWLGRHTVKRKVSQRTINYELRALHTFFLWAIKRNYLFINPASSVERFRLPKKALPKFMTTEELKKFFAACDEDDRRLYMSILLTGMRKGEVEHLTWADISLELGVIFIQEKPEMNWKPKSDERLIPISPMLHEILLVQRLTRGSNVLVFPNSQGNRDTHILERLKSLCRAAGIRPSTVHGLRHSFGAHLRMAGVSLADIGDLLGHKDLATTQIYAKVHQEHLRTAIAKLGPIAADFTSDETQLVSPKSTQSVERPTDE